MKVFVNFHLMLILCNHYKVFFIRKNVKKKLVA